MLCPVVEQALPGAPYMPTSVAEPGDYELFVVMVTAACTDAGAVWER